MARPRVPLDKMTEAYTIALNSNVDDAAEKTGLSKRTVHSVMWAMDVAPKIREAIKSKELASGRA